ANKNLVLGGDFNCVMNAMDKKGGRPFDSKNAAVTAFESTIRVHSFVDAWRIVNLHNIGFTWSNPKCLPAFYHEIITFWQDVIASNPKSKNDVLEQIVWNNKFIKSDKKSIYLQHWRYAGILKIYDLFDTQQNCFLSFDSFRNKFNVRCNFL
ncbi:unnamed protein product, partial [Porites evermanni]